MIKSIALTVAVLFSALTVAQANAPVKKDVKLDVQPVEATQEVLPVVDSTEAPVVETSAEPTPSAE